jgi:signal transduction histidine kinase
VHDLQLELEREKLLIERKREKQTGDFVRQHAIKQAVYKKLESLDAAVVIPLHLNNQPLGLVILSDKLNGEGYHQQDMALLDVVGGQAISSIQKAKLYEGDQMKSEFVSIASHELLTPISAMEGYLSMILDEGIGKVDPQAREYLSKVYTSAKRLSLLIKDLLSVSRIESGKMKVESQQLDMVKMVTDTIDQLRFMAKDKGLELIFEAPTKPLPPVWADPDRTMQVMVNLVSNSIKYTRQGTVTISFDVDKHQGTFKTSVTDSGIGLSKSAQKHLFNKFYRVDSPETTGIIGTGLGLYITKSIIEKMGGTISCKSTEGKGSTFSFTLPLFKVETSTLG